MFFIIMTATRLLTWNMSIDSSFSEKWQTNSLSWLFMPYSQQLPDQLLFLSFSSISSLISAEMQLFLCPTLSILFEHDFVISITSAISYLPLFSWSANKVSELIHKKGRLFHQTNNIGKQNGLSQEFPNAPCNQQSYQHFNLN